MTDVSRFFRLLPYYGMMMIMYSNERDFVDNGNCKTLVHGQSYFVVKTRDRIHTLWIVPGTGKINFDKISKLFHSFHEIVEKLPKMSNSITHSISTISKPQLVITVYKCESEYYLESHDIDDLEPVMAGKPFITGNYSRAWWMFFFDEKEKTLPQWRNCHQIIC